MRLAILAILAILAGPAAAETLTGPARVVDGDTLRVGGVAVRIRGLACPERREPGGLEATAALEALTEGRLVRCALTRERTWGRRVGTCFVDETDVATVLVLAGLCRPCSRYSRAYDALEQPGAMPAVLPGYCEVRR